MSIKPEALTEHVLEVQRLANRLSDALAKSPELVAYGHACRLVQAAREALEQAKSTRNAALNCVPKQYLDLI